MAPTAPAAVIGVAGAGGLIGSHAVAELCAAGRTVVAIDRPGADLSVARDAGATVRQADLAHDGEAERAFAGCERLINATGLFDFAAPVEQLERANVQLTRSVVRAARRVGVTRLVQLSSVAVYGRPARVPMAEDGPLAPRNPYERSKLAGEMVAVGPDAGDMEVVLARPTLVYGPRARYGHAVMIALCAQAHAHRVPLLPIPPGGPLSHHVHVVDVARALTLLCEHPNACGSYNIADDRPAPVGDCLAAIARRFGYRAAPRLLSATAWLALGPALAKLPAPLLGRLNARLDRGHRALAKRGRGGRLAPQLDRDWLGYLSGRYVFETGRLSALGFSPRYPDFRAAIGDVIDWYRQARWLPGQDQA